MKKMFLLFLLLNLLFLSSGCWDIREINELGLVTAVAIDKSENPNRYSVTVQIANSSNEGSSDNKSKAKFTEWIGTTEGESIFDAVRKLVGISSRRIMWAHNNVVIIGESLAREGIIPVVDYFTHSPELRMKAVVVVAKGDAKEYITAKVGMEKPSGVSFILLESYRALVAESVESHMLKVSADLRNEYSNPLITAISLKRAIAESEEKGDAEKSTETIELTGAAVFKKDKMIGWLTPEEVLGVSWILNETKDTVVTVKDPWHENKNVAVETKNVKAKIETAVTGGMPAIRIDLRGNGDIAEEDSSTSRSMDEMKENIEDLLNQKIMDEIKKSLDIVQKEYMADVFGFAAIVHAHNDREWKNGLKDRWEEIFPQIPVTVSVDIEIDSSTLNQEPMKVY